VGFKIVILGVCITGALSSAWEACTMLIGIQKCSFIMLLEALLHSFPGGVARAHGGDSVCRQWAVFFFFVFFSLNNLSFKIHFIFFPKKENKIRLDGNFD
jgi:hypothetical protein